MKRTKLTPPYIAVEEFENKGILYNSRGEYSVVFSITNPFYRHSADESLIYKYNDTITNLIKVLGQKYAIQKQDIFVKKAYEAPQETHGYLSKKYFEYFNGREYSYHISYITITQEKSSGFLQYKQELWKDFWTKIDKVLDLLLIDGFNPNILNKEELNLFANRYFALNFKDKSFSLSNICSNESNLRFDQRDVKVISLINIDEIDMPSQISPYHTEFINGSPYITDLLSFLPDSPVETLIYNQSIFIPNQKLENSKLLKKFNRHSSLPSASNQLSAQDIAQVQTEIERDNKLLVYIHYSLITAGKNIEPAINYIEGQLFRRGYRTSKSNYNQMELFLASLPGCSYQTQHYDRFLTLHNIAGCLMYKERLNLDEDTPLKIYYTNREGIPKAIDITGKEGKNRLTTNSNFFCLGPSGSGKSFHMNSVVRQLYEQDTDIVMVDTGHSYQGLCRFLGGKYITYSEDNPISMNPFLITQEEYNIEKINFLKSLIFVIWKQGNGIVSKVEDEIIHKTIETYYKHYFTPFTQYNEREKDTRMQMLMIEIRSQQKKDIDTNITNRQRRRLDAVKALSEFGVGGEKDVAKIKLDELTDKYKLDVNSEILLIIKEEISYEEEVLRDMIVSELNFNSFYEFAIKYIPFIMNTNGVKLDFPDFKFILSRFYKGGTLEKTLNQNMDTSLFNEKFIVFEIDAIKDDPVLFPIVTLIIMDVFLQKMRLKKNRKALIIEEAWKALASDLMAGYILYLYKTVRKFWGIVGVVTQEVEDIISSEVVKSAILNNSEITILLDQTKLKDRFDDIKQLLGLPDTECSKIWTINNLDNKNNRGFFSEVYIKRGSYGEVFGVEESPQSYMAYTTEKVEKEALNKYQDKYQDISLAIEHFCNDWKASGIKRAIDFSKIVLQ